MFKNLELKDPLSTIIEMSSFILWFSPLCFKVLSTNKEKAKQNSELIRFFSVGRVTRHRHSPCQDDGGLGCGYHRLNTLWRSLLQPWWALQRHHKGWCHPLPTYLHPTSEEEPKEHHRPWWSGQARELHTALNTHVHIPMCAVHRLAPNHSPTDQMSAPSLGY